tara:strand:- start:15 stop:233 length:219 start_codon:yes stop_codon:yes gene_type:complete
MIKYDFEVGDLLIKKNEVGILYRVNKTPYGLEYAIYWSWCLEGNNGTVTLPDLMLCKAFFNKYSIIKGVIRS